MRTAYAALTIGLLTVVLVPGLGAGENVEECVGSDEAVPVEVCAVDRQDGDKEACEDYRGVTAATVRAGEQRAQAGGETQCHHSYEEERIFVQGTSSEVGWNAIEISWDRSSIAGDVQHVVLFSQGFNSVDYESNPCEIEIRTYNWVFLVGTVGPNHYQDCPEGPPASPNPGWGDLTP